MRYVRSAAAGIALLLLAPFTLPGQDAGLSITNFRLITEERASRTQWFVTYRADLANTGAARTAVTATVTSTVPSVQIVAGQGVLHFASAPANSQTPSAD